MGESQGVAVVRGSYGQVVEEIAHLMRYLIGGADIAELFEKPGSWFVIGEEIGGATKLWVGLTLLIVDNIANEM